MRSDTSVDGAFLLAGGAGGRSGELAAYLDEPGAERATRDAGAWIKSLRHAPVGGRRLRDRFTHRGDSLWWFIELFLARERVVVSAFKTLAALQAMLERESPRGLTLVRGDWITRTLAPEAARLHAGGLHCSRAAAAERKPRRRNGIRHLGETVLPRLRPPVSAPADGCDLAVFVHAAFWRTTNDPDRGGDSYLGRVIRALRQRIGPARIRLVGIGPRVSPRARRERRPFSGNRPGALPFPRVDRYASLRAVLPSLRVWRRRNAMRRAVRASAALRRAALVGGCDLWPVLGPELDAAVRVQLPWAARAMDEVGAALDALRPRAALTYAEAGGWGRALVLEGRRRGIPVIGAQHGFIDRHVLDYLHEPDEMQPSAANAADRGYPLPDLTLLFDGCAAGHLRTAGRFPPSSLRVTGSPQLDVLAARMAGRTPGDLAAARAEAGAGDGQHVVFVASKFTEIRPAFGDLAAAVRALPAVRAVVKCHPAEVPAPYRQAAAGTPNLTVLPADADLAALLCLARIVVTVNSTVAVDAMTLGIPVLVLGLPNNLSPFVDAGAMAGLAMRAPIGPVLRELLHDETRRNALAERARAFRKTHDVRADGRAAQRCADAVTAFLKR